MALDELGEDLQGGVVLVKEMVGHGVSDPGGALGGTKSKESVARLLEAIEIAHLDLQEGEVAKDLHVILVASEGVAVGLDSFLVLLLGSVEEAVDVPADVGLYIGAKSAFDGVAGILSLALAVEDESLHGERLPVLRMRLEDLVGQSQSVPVLLLLVVLDDLAKHGLIPRRQHVLLPRRRPASVLSRPRHRRALLSALLSPLPLESLQPRAFLLRSQHCLMQQIHRLTSHYTPYPPHLLETRPPSHTVASITLVSGPHSTTAFVSIPLTLQAALQSHTSSAMPCPIQNSKRRSRICTTNAVSISAWTTVAKKMLANEV